MANEIDVYIGRRLREARFAKGMSQEALGRALGISFQQLQKYEKGSNRISGSRLWDISIILEMPVGYFFEGLEPKGKTRKTPTPGTESRLSRRTIQLASALNALEDKDVKAHFLRLIKAYARMS